MVYQDRLWCNRLAIHIHSLKGYIKGERDITYEYVWIWEHRNIGQDICISPTFRASLFWFWSWQHHRHIMTWVWLYWQGTERSPNLGSWFFCRMVIGEWCGRVAWCPFRWIIVMLMYWWWLNEDRNDTVQMFYTRGQWAPLPSNMKRYWFFRRL